MKNNEQINVKCRIKLVVYVKKYGADLSRKVHWFLERKLSGNI